MPHIHDKIDFTAEAFIIYNDTLLLRMHDKYKLWLGVGGHIELDEDPNQAVIREVKEEVGLDVTLVSRYTFPEPVMNFEYLVEPFFLNRHRVSPTHEHVTMTFIALSDSDNVVPDGHDRSDTWKWFTIEELDDPRYEIPSAIVFTGKEALRFVREMKK